MFDLTRNAPRVRSWLPGWIVLGLALVLWIPTFDQAWQMLSLHASQAGTMGLALGPFLVYWTGMMGAMMLPALAPVVTARYQFATHQNSVPRASLAIFLFIGAYLAPWTLFGVLAFLLARLGQYWVLHAPTPGMALGLGLLVISGGYQMTPLKTRFLRQCNPTLCCTLAAQTTLSIRKQLSDGLLHGMICLGCCGALMLVMVAVGLMSLPWMLLLTLVIFLEKTWSQGTRFAFFVGFALLVFVVLALAEPVLLSGVVPPMAPGL